MPWWGQVLVLATGRAGPETIQEHLYLEINRIQTNLKLRKRLSNECPAVGTELSEPGVLFDSCRGGG